MVGSDALQAQTQSIQSMSSQFQDVRAQLESDEQLKILMAGLRGSNLNDSDYAEEGVNMVMVEVSRHCRIAPRNRASVLT